MTLGNRDRDPRIRHLPPGDAEGLPSSPAKRTPHAAALIGGPAVFLVILVVFGLGGAEPQAPPNTTLAGLIGDDPVDFAPPGTLAPSLGERLGNDVESLRLATITAEGATEVLLWLADGMSPRRYPISSRALDARFDVSGKFVAYVDGETVYLQQTGHRLEMPLLETARGFAWHPTDEARMAFGIIGPTGTDILEGHATALTSRAAIVASVPGDVTVVGWGDWGYALAFDASSVLGGGVPGILVVDGDGAPLRAIAGEWLDSAGGTILVRGPDAETAAAWTQRIETAAPAPVVAPTPVGVDLIDENLESYGVFAGDTTASFDVVMDDSGDHVAITAGTKPSNDGGQLVPGAVSVTIVDFNERVPRVVGFSEDVTPVGFVRGGQALAVQSAMTGELLLVDTRTGATVRLPIAPGTSILDAWL
jgi:hypothetical protein